MPVTSVTGSYCQSVDAILELLAFVGEKYTEDITSPCRKELMNGVEI